METWWTITSTDFVIQNEFAAVFISAGAPQEAALFSVCEPGSKTIEFYFTPAAARLAQGLLVRHGATECSRPDNEHLALLVGNQASV